MTVKRYRKKPVEFEALQWNGDNLQECKDFLGDSYGGHAADRHRDGRSEITVLTLEGVHTASLGDYLVRGVQGEHYPVRPDIFEQINEPVEEDQEEENQ